MVGYYVFGGGFVFGGFHFAQRHPTVFSPEKIEKCG